MNMYVMPSFKYFEPKKLKLLCQKIERQDDDNHNLLIDPERIDKVFIKLRHDEVLSKRDIKILCCHLSRALSEGLFSKFMVVLYEFLQKNNKLYFYLKGLLLSYYKMQINNDSDDVFRLLKLGFLKNTRWKEDILGARDLFLQSMNTKELLQRLDQEINSIFDKDQLLIHLRKYLLKKDDELARQLFYFRAYGLISKKKYKNQVSFFLDFIIDFLDLNTRKKVYEALLLAEKNEVDDLHDDKNLDIIFEHIGNELGDPYSKYNVKWQNISQEAIDVFRLWQTQKKLHFFFTDIAGDPRRLDFWQKYKKYFYRVHYIRELENVLLMETAKHVFVEFAVIGALYMYDKKDLNIDDVITMQRNRNRNKSFIVGNILKNRSNSIFWSRHTGYWEQKFAGEFYYYGYKFGGE